MKLYELAKKIGVKTADLTKAAKAMGIEKAGNFTPLSEAQEAGLTASFMAKKAPPKPKTEETPKVEAPKVEHHKGTPLKAVTREEDRNLLVSGRNKALASYRTRNKGRKPYVPMTPLKPSPAPSPVAKAETEAIKVDVKPEPVHEVKIEAPKVEAKKPVEAPKPVTPKAVEISKPSVEPVKVEAPKTETKVEPKIEAQKAELPKIEKESSKPVEPPKVEKPKEQPKAEAPKEPIKIDLGSFSGIGQDVPAGKPVVVFHPAEEDDYEDDGDDRRGGRYDDDDSDEDLQRAYFGSRSNSQNHETRHHRDSYRDENDRDGKSSRSQHGSHGQQGQHTNGRGGAQPQMGGARIQGAQGRNGGQGQRPQQGRNGQQGQRSGQNQNQGRGRDQRGQRDQRSGQGQRPNQQVGNNNNGRNGQAPSVFPTRPGAQSVFPTRPQANSVFPTRPNAPSVFPTRPNAPSVFPTRPQQGNQGGRMNGPQGKNQQGKNQRGQQQMNKNQRNFKDGQKNQGQTPPPPPPPPQNAPIIGDHVISLRGPTPIGELAEMMGIRPNRLIADLLQEKILVSINQRVDLEMAGKIASKYNYRIELERARRSTERKPEIRRLDEDDEIPEDKPEDMKPRPPVVTFMGHVDHGKTSLLDYIRKTKVAAGEAGGITQHIGAYSVEVADRKITFLDTPGHAAFSAMRARGARLTDIAVIVVAADDGIMPQTREVIKDCRQANVQIMVAINKCDLPQSKPDRVRQQLQGEGLTPEDWGGDIVCCEVSAKTGAGMDNLLEMILLQADVLELQANPNRRADGYVLEAQMERGIGPTATLLVASGTLSAGDVVLVDEHYGRLRALIDDRGNQVKSASPATAVRVMGLSGVPEAGAEFRVMTNEKRAKELAEKFSMERKAQELQQAQKAVNLDTLLTRLGEQSKKQLSIIVKADTQGTVEAIIDTLKDIRSEKITLEILASSVGNVSATDVQKAAAGKAIIVGFQVNTESGVAPLATHDGVRINTFRIIYELFDFVKQSMLDLLDPEYKEVVKGHAQIRQIFDIGKLGKVAGCQLLDGVVRKDAFVRIKRLREVLFEGKISSLKHFKDEVNEVRDMQEFGVSFVGFENFNEGDVIECYAMEELERTL